MNFNDYQLLASVTEAPVDAAFDRLNEKTLRILHGAIGVCTEAGELQDALKRQIYYGKTLDEINIAEEIGDVMWYVALLCNSLGVNLEDVCERNIAKLKARYGEKFSNHAAINRDLDTERKVLEGKSCQS
jgi:NTP pyrophosphatase (non-canonical NTP hydrolase)